MRVMAIETMNKRTREDISGYIADSEGHYLRQIENAARDLAAQAEEKPVILISGPSGSGKTTTAFRISAELNKLGYETFALSMDNYFLPLSDPRNEVDQDGKIDFESPKRLDMELLNEHLDKILKCGEITLPVFDFARQERDWGEKFKRKNGELVIIEGIHALNPEITGSASGNAVCVYVSVRTRIKNKSGKLLHPSKIRLTRRLVRDKLFRGREAEKTLEFFKRVERGEKLYIMPFKPRADYNIDTFVSYETAVYKTFLEEELTRLSGDNAYCAELMRFLSEMDIVELERSPLDSLVREFAGGSSYSY